MKKNIIVDIDVIIEYLKTGKGALPKAYEKFSMKIASTTYAELLASTTFKDEGLEKEVIDFVKKYFEVVSVDEEISMAAAKILRDNDITFATAIVAATAMVKKYELLAADAKDYTNIEGVEVLSI